jgi:twinkle protein|tara:strand:- start:1261 stop:2937 length:1677 start_codon:yes stop_codon:yes gene_type:complete
MKEQSKFIKYHVPCHDCGSKDAVSVNADGSAKCFSCDKFYSNYEGNVTSMEKYIQQQPTPTPIKQLNAHGGVFAKLTDRNICKETAEKYGVKVVYDSSGQLAQHHYPFYINNEHCATKIRYIRDKNFKFEGSLQDTGLFGQNLFKEGGKYLTIVEGECDAMAGYELLGSKWAVVSIKRGAASAVKDVKESLEYVESFDNVVICFDNDKAGIKASQEVASIIKPGKAKIVTLPNGYKDPNEMLNKGKHQDFTRSWWDAQVYTPTGIIRVSEKQKDFLNRERKQSVSYPWEGLNKKLLGLRAGELVTLTGGTGLGKSSITREIEHWLINQTEDNVGIIALEEDWKRTVDGILSIEANDKLFIDTVRDEYGEAKLTSMFDKVFSNDRVFIHAHFGANDIDAIFAKLRYLIVGCDCKWVVVDHLHMLVSSMLDGDERKAIDNIMHRLRSMVEETGAGIILVSHLRRIEGNKGHENGVSVSLSHLRGSNSIAQLSDCVIALERNQQSEDDLESRTTRLRILKSRYTGDVGMACSLVYDKETGRLAEYEDLEILNSKAEDIIPF